MLKRDDMTMESRYELTDDKNELVVTEVTTNKVSLSRDQLKQSIANLQSQLKQIETRADEFRKKISELQEQLVQMPDPDEELEKELDEELEEEDEDDGA